MGEDLVKKQLQEEKARCDDLTNQYKRLDSELQSALQHGEGRWMNLTRQKDAVEQRLRVSHDCVIRLQNELLLERQTEKNEVSRQEPTREEHADPWDCIPEHGWDRRAVELLHRGDSMTEIAEELHISPARIRNRLSELRNRHGTDVVPYRETITKLLRKKK